MFVCHVSMFCHSPEFWCYCQVPIFGLFLSRIYILFFTSNYPNFVIFYFLDVSIYCVSSFLGDFKINLSSSFLISCIFLFVNVKIQATQCDSLPPYLQFDHVCVGAFPSMSIHSQRAFYENGTQPKN